MNATTMKPEPAACEPEPRPRPAAGWAAIERRARAMAAADAMLERLADELGIDDETRRELGIVTRRGGK